MKVNVVISESKSSWILARMVRHLARYNEWRVGSRPSQNVDVNVFFPYLFWRDTGHFKKTRTVGFMTHRETTVGIKTRIWDKTAPQFDLRITMARQYAEILHQFGPTVNIPPPVELDMFKPVPRQAHKMPVIGVCGWVYPGGRKGEKLVLELYRKMKHKWVIGATGRRWPIPKCYDRPWAKMPKWYQCLDVFLCTSVIEGGPVTVLEALACGRPVVIPKGVGLLDELPDGPGIYRYGSGNYKSMLHALSQAVQDKTPPEKLAEIVATRTPKRYAEEWKSAVENMVDAEKKPVALPAKPWTLKNSGVYAVAYGKHARDCVYHLAGSVQKRMPGLPICIVTDDAFPALEKRLSGVGELKTVALVDKRARTQKTLIWEYAPQDWEYVLYMDADMLAIGNLRPFFDPLQDGWDMVLTLSPPRAPLVRQAQRAKYKEENRFTNKILRNDSWLQIAGGIWSFRRNSRTERFLAEFHQEWTRYQHTDQQAMMRALWKYQVKTWILPREFNWFVHHGPPNKRAAVLHFATAARAWTEKHPGRQLWRQWIKKV